MLLCDERAEIEELIKQLAASAGGGSSMSINPGGEPSSPFMKADNPDYKHEGSTIFLGTDIVTPTNFIVAVEAEKSGDIGKTIDVKIFDATNGLTLAEQTITLVAARVIEDLGSISNLPTDEAAIEMQLKKGDTNGGNGKIFGFKDKL